MIPELDWTELDDKAVDTARVLAMDAVQKVGNGHPGTAMSLAPASYLLFQKVMRHDPADPQWIARDRFVLSCGHSSITLYTQLFLGGFGLELSDLQALRTWGSKTPGHPEYGHTAGVEVTTGPLGQGVANAVGMAMSGRRVHGLLDPDAAMGEGEGAHDPRKAQRFEGRVLLPRMSVAEDDRIALGYRCARSNMTIAVAADHIVECGTPIERIIRHDDDLAKLALRTELPEGGTLRVEKLVAYHSSRGVPASQESSMASISSSPDLSAPAQVSRTAAVSTASR